MNATAIIPPATGTKQRRDEFGLTLRERQVVDCLVDGMRPDKIALLLGLTLYTTRTYLRNIMKRTGTHHRAELIALVAGRAS